MAGRWPLDRYYRCNIVNNIPLSQLARETAFMSAQVMAHLVAGRAAGRRDTLYQDPLPALPMFTVEYSFFGHALSRHARCLAEENTEDPHTLFSFAAKRLGASGARLVLYLIFRCEYSFECCLHGASCTLR